MMSRSPLANRLFHNDRIILISFALYGLVAGSMAYVWRASLMDFYPVFYFYMNIPVMLIMAFIEVYFGNPLGFLGSYPAALIPLYTILWSSIGLVVYGVVKMLRL